MSQILTVLSVEQVTTRPCMTQVSMLMMLPKWEEHMLLAFSV